MHSSALGQLPSDMIAAAGLDKQHSAAMQLVETGFKQCSWWTLGMMGLPIYPVS